MLHDSDFIRQSLELHLFFARIMKEHSFFLEIGFTPRDDNYTKQADEFRQEFDKFLWDVVSISNNVLSPAVLQSGEIITQYTLSAERASSFYTGLKIPTELTQSEAELNPGDCTFDNKDLEHKVYSVNCRAIELTSALIRFKSNILSNVINCKMFTVNYPLLIDHVMREAKFYLRMIQKLQNRDIIDTRKEILEQELFWNQIMAEHSKFIRGLLDPTEEDLIHTANQFGQEFDQLTDAAKAAMDSTIPEKTVTDDSLDATRALRDFKAQGTQGLIECKIKSIIIPLLGDHTLREANHYLRLLKIFES